LKRKIKNAPILAMANLQRPFELEIHANGYALGVMLMQGGRLVYYHAKLFDKVVLDYPMYDKDIYVIM
jgi:hypothetical protein